VTDAVSGDVIEVAAGTYAESVVFGGKDLELIGVDGFAATYIDGPADAIHVDGAGASVVRGFNVRSAGRGIVAVNVGSLLIEDIVMDGFGQASTSYGLHMQQVTDLEIRGIAITTFDSDATPIGIFNQCGFVLADSNFGFNQAAAGGALVLADSDGEVSNCTFLDNGGENGAAIEANSTSVVQVANSRFYDNAATGRGGAIYADACEVEVAWSHFIGNSAGRGGAIALDEAPAGTAVHHNRIIDNDASVQGGGLFVDGGEVTIENNAFASNTAVAQGGGLRLFEVTAEAINNTFANNDAPIGGGISTSGGAVELTNVIVTGAPSGTGVEGDEFVTVGYCDVFGNAGGEYEGSMTDPTGSDGNISADPMYVDTLAPDPAAWDLHLQISSPCIDTGDPDPALDDADGTQSDMGAYGGPEPLASDEDLDGWSLEDGDCDDTDPASYPGGTEVCDAADNNCDGAFDEGFDVDADGVTTCGPDGIMGSPDDDCDDADPVNFGGNTEICDGGDNDCDGQLLDGEDVDNDGDGSFSCADCDDTNPNRYPGAEEICDGIADNDCDGVEDSEDVDDDGDTQSECEGDCDDTDTTQNSLDQDNDDWTTCDGDCNDGIASMNPGEEEECDGIDNDCDGVLPDDEEDADVDGFMSCEGDCADDDATVYLGAAELCDGKDNDCDGYLSAEEEDDDGDGFNECEDGDCDDGDPDVYPGAPEICDGIDQNCNSVPDDSDECYEPDYGVAGGGGCDCDVTGRGDRAAGTFGLALLLAGGLALARRRRLRPGGRTLRALLPLALCLLIPGLAGAQLKPEVELHSLRANADGMGLFSVEGAETLGMLKPSFGLHLSYAKDPLLLNIVEDPYYPQDRYTYSLVGTLLTADLKGAIGFGPADVGLSLPIHVLRMGEGAFEWDEMTGAGIGDLRITPKVQVFNPARRMYGLAVTLPLTFPLSNATSGVGDPAMRIEPTVVGEFRWGPIQTALNLGPRIRTSAMAMNAIDLNVRHEFVIRYGLGVQPIPQLQVVGEILAAAGGSGDGTNPAEFFAGARIFPGKNLRIEIGGGRGLNDGYGSPDLRVMAGVTWMQAQEYEPLPMRDSDGDGIADGKDGCAKEAEDVDGFEDADGCPDKDNDRDGFLDTEDQCPDEAENFNANQDDDGCPDDDPDTDGDGLTDRDDPCPGDPETLNGIDDFDGCPEESLAQVTGDWTRISVDEPVVFKSGRDTIVSGVPTLAAVAKILLVYPEILSLEIQVHTDDVGKESRNLSASQKQAEAVVAKLGEAKVSAERLVARGYGESQPILPDTSDAARAVNRRVEFHILELSVKPQPVVGIHAEEEEEEGPKEGEGEELTEAEIEQQEKLIRRTRRKKRQTGEDESVKAEWEETEAETEAEAEAETEAETETETETETEPPAEEKTDEPDPWGD
jgi:predicted outer membrane repeat protein